MIALLPAATAVTAVLRGHERPPTSFWVIATAGAIAAVGFAAVQGGGLGVAQRLVVDAIGVGRRQDGVAGCDHIQRVLRASGGIEGATLRT